MVYVFLADGFEEIEALSPVDFLRRAGIEVLTVGVTGDIILGAHDINVLPDIALKDIVLDDKLEAVILPGGMPGAENLYNSKEVNQAIDYAIEHKKLVSAICAAPFILGRKGLLENKKATCFPGFENELKGAVVSDDGVVSDGNIITARGAGVAWEFSEAISAYLVGKEKSQKILSGLQWKK